MSPLTLKESDAIKALREGSIGSPAFKQVLAIFKSDGLVHQPASCLQSAVAVGGQTHHPALFRDKRRSKAPNWKPLLARPEQAAEEIDGRAGAEHMKTQSDENRKPWESRALGITLRTALFSWLASIATLLIFVAVIIPQAETHVPGKPRIQSSRRGRLLA
jgi:hypothetical protein